MQQRARGRREWPWRSLSEGHVGVRRACFPCLRELPQNDCLCCVVSLPSFEQVYVHIVKVFSFCNIN